MVEYFAPPHVMVRPPVMPVARPHMPVPPVRSGVGAQTAQRRGPTIGDRTIGMFGRLSNLSTRLYYPGRIFLPFLPMVPLPIPGMVAKALGHPMLGRFALKSASPAVDMALVAPITTLHGVQGRDWHQTPARIAEQISNIAKGAEGIWIGKKLADPDVPVENQLAMRAAARLQESGSKFGETVAGGLRPIRAGIKGVVQRVDATGVGRAVSRQVNRFAKWRGDRSAALPGKAREAALKAFTTTTEPVGFFRRIGNLVTPAKPGTSSGPLPAELKAAQQFVQKGQFKRALKSIEAANETFQATLTKKYATDAAREAAAPAIQAATYAAGRATEVQQHLIQSRAASASVRGWKHMANTNLTGAFSHASKVLGSTSMFKLALVGTVAAGAIAIGLSTRKQNREAKRARADLKRMLGDNPQHPLMQAVDKSQGPQRWGRRATATASSAGQALFLVPGMGHIGMGMTALSIFAIPKLIKEDTVLNAFQAMQHPGVPPEQRVMALRALMAPLPATPTDEPNAPVIGEYNRLSAAMAEEWVAQKTPLQEIMAVLGDRQKFFAFAEQVNAKHKVTEQAQAAQAAPAAPVQAMAPVVEPTANQEGSFVARENQRRAAAAAQLQAQPAQHPGRNG